ncbi:sugar ABC transporter permease YjfF [Planctomycetota bacterium]|nr:sugar ABC transporter permease YjfF [Planctomycetota bacterium]
MIIALKPKPQHLPLIATISVLLILYVTASMRYYGFASWYQTTSLLTDSAPLGLAAIGMTFVILSGGIDLSVGAVIALSSILLAQCMAGAEQGGFNFPSYVAIPIVLLVGIIFGGSMGILIRLFQLPPFLVTLAGMFLARGVALNLTASKRLAIVNEPTFDPLVNFLFFGLNLPAIIFIVILVIAIVISSYTRFGRVVYAIGGNERSALLAGLPVGSTTVKIYALSGLCASIGGILYAIGSQSGDASVGYLLELDAIAAVVIGGTLLSGGVGYVFGTLLGVIILGIITIIPTYEGDLNSWWTRIAIGGLLFFFIAAQRVLNSLCIKNTSS